MISNTPSFSTDADVPAEEKKPRILVIDDDVTVRSLAEHHLSEAGFDVTTLAEGSSAVETFLTLRPAAVLLDVMLPDSDGFDLCRTLRKLPEARHTPIVMLTSLNDEKAIRSAFEAGATEFVSKPIHWLHESYRLRYLLRAASTLRDLDQARQTITQSEEDWRKTFDAIEDPVLVLNSNLTIRRANQGAARMSGFLVADLLGRSCHEAFGCGFNDSVHCPAKRSLEGGTPIQTEMRGFGRGKRDCLVSIAPVSSGDSSPALVFSIKDVTEYRELQKELLQAQKMEALGVLSAGVAHDFNNLLQGIMGWADVLAMETPTQEELQEGLAQMSSVAARGRALTQQLLFTSRKALGQKTEVAIGPLLEEIAVLLSHTQPKTIQMETKVPGDLWKVNADVSHLHQAVMNLAVNAAQAMDKGGTLQLLAENVILDSTYCLYHADSHIGPHVMIAVSDTGTGIDKELLSRIYDPFFTTKGPNEGTGLGLSIVFGILRDHGGHICCYSEPGQGTTFRMYLPALEPGGSADDSAEAGEKRPAASGDGKTILLAEDEPLILSLLVRILERQGYRTLQACNGKEALEIYLEKADSIDGIILDMNMPVMGGDECLLELAKNGCRAPTLLATGALFSSERQTQLLDQAAGIVMKPFHGTQLLSTLEQALSASDRPGK